MLSLVRSLPLSHQFARGAFLPFHEGERLFRRTRQVWAVILNRTFRCTCLSLLSGAASLSPEAAPSHTRESVSHGCSLGQSKRENLLNFNALSKMIGKLCVVSAQHSNAIILTHSGLTGGVYGAKMVKERQPRARSQCGRFARQNGSDRPSGRRSAVFSPMWPHPCRGRGSAQSAGHGCREAACRSVPW